MFKPFFFIRSINVVAFLIGFLLFFALPPFVVRDVLAQQQFVSDIPYWSLIDDFVVDSPGSKTYPAYEQYTIKVERVAPYTSGETNLYSNGAWLGFVGSGGSCFGYTMSNDFLSTNPSLTPLTLSWQGLDPNPYCPGSTWMTPTRIRVYVPGGYEPIARFTTTNPAGTWHFLGAWRGVGNFDLAFPKQYSAVMVRFELLPETRLGAGSRVISGNSSFDPGASGSCGGGYTAGDHVLSPAGDTLQIRQRGCEMLIFRFEVWIPEPPSPPVPDPACVFATDARLVDGEWTVEFGDTGQVSYPVFGASGMPQMVDLSGSRSWYWYFGPNAFYRVRLSGLDLNGNRVAYAPGDDRILDPSLIWSISSGYLSIASVSDQSEAVAVARHVAVCPRAASTPTPSVRPPRAAEVAQHYGYSRCWDPTPQWADGGWTVRYDGYPYVYVVTLDTSNYPPWDPERRFFRSRFPVVFVRDPLFSSVDVDVTRHDLFPPFRSLGVPVSLGAVISDDAYLTVDAGSLDDARRVYLCDASSPSPTRTPTITRTPLPTRTPTITRTPLPTRTPTITRTPTSTRTPTATRTPTVTQSTTPVRTADVVDTVVPISLTPFPDGVDTSDSLIEDIQIIFDEISKLFRLPSYSCRNIPVVSLPTPDNSRFLAPSQVDIFRAVCAVFEVISPVTRWVRWLLTAVFLVAVVSIFLRVLRVSLG